MQDAEGVDIGHGSADARGQGKALFQRNGSQTARLPAPGQEVLAAIGVFQKERRGVEIPFQ